jgi:hypothetical protein
MHGSINIKLVLRINWWSYLPLQFSAASISCMPEIHLSSFEFYKPVLVKIEETGLSET